MKEQEKALNWLSRDPALYVSMTEPIRRGMTQKIVTSEQGVAIILSDVTMVGAEDLSAALSLIKETGDFRQLTVAGGALAQEVSKALGLELTCLCRQCVYWGKELLPVHEDIRPLDMTYFQEILDGYHLFHDPDYIRERIEARVFYGVFVEDTLAGFVGEHTEGSMGMLEIFPAYRRRGLGYALECFEINRCLTRGWVPFDQVVVGNENSMSLQRKVGMELSGDTVSWLAKR